MEMQRGKVQHMIGMRFIDPASEEMDQRVEGVDKSLRLME